MSRSRMGRSRFAVAVVAALALAGCSGSASDASSAGSEAKAVASGGGAEPAAGDASRDAGSGSSAVSATGARVDAAAVDPAALSRRLVRTGDLSLRVDSVPASIAKVRSVVTLARGLVTDEKTHTEPARIDEGDGSSVAASTESVLTLRVPETALDKVLDDLGRLGTVLSRAQSSTDVTSQYVDTASRLRTQRESVDRVRALLGQAKTIGQVVQVESELARRQADLEALQARLAALKDQTALGTLVVSLTTRERAATVPPNAFGSGLSNGWNALVASVAVALIIAGALLPFAVLLTLTGAPVLFVLMRRRRTRSEPAAG